MRRKLSTLIIGLSIAGGLFNSAFATRFVTSHKIKLPGFFFKTDSISADSIINFAESLIGVRYRSATSDPLRGFDCSGFVSYVFKKFNFNVPRSSGEFINIGEKISLEEALPGDIIIFTSPKKHSRRIGHVAIVYSNTSDGLKFIHSTSGKEHGVTITAMDDTYRKRFVQVVRLLKQNDSARTPAADVASI
jgi:cell wall-associated NlpC family hydrolase